MNEQIDYLLPPDWVNLTLGQLVQNRTEKVEPNKSENESYIGLEHIESGTGRLIGQGSSKDVVSTKTMFRKGDILYGKLRPYLNKVYVAQFDGICSTDIMVLRPLGGVPSEFIAYRLLSQDFVRYANSGSKGVNLPRADPKHILSFPLAVPSLAEQRRIAEKIDKLQNQADSCSITLKRILLRIKLLKNSLLDNATNGRLTTGWRNKNRTEESESIKESVFVQKLQTLESKKGKEWSMKPTFEYEKTLPNTWILAPIGNISLFVTDGDHNPPPRVPEGIPHLTAKNIIDWRLSENGCSFISKSDYEKVKKRYSSKPEDVVVTCVGTIGRTCIVPDNYVFSADRNLAIIRPIPQVLDSDYLQYYLNTASVQLLLKKASGSTAQPHLYLNEIRTFPIALPPISEQKEIVRIVKMHLSGLAVFEGQVEGYIQQVNSLRQSFMRKAFEGRLVPHEQELQVNGPIMLDGINKTFSSTQSRLF